MSKNPRPPKGIVHGQLQMHPTSWHYWFRADGTVLTPAGRVDVPNTVCQGPNKTVFILDLMMEMAVNTLACKNAVWAETATLNSIEKGPNR